MQLLVLIVVAAIGFGLCSIVGSVAKKRGRSFWGWTLIPLLLSFITGLLFGALFASQGGRDETSLLLILYIVGITLPTFWLIALISALIAGKTRGKRLEEVAEEERLREQIKQRNGY